MMRKGENVGPLITEYGGKAPAGYGVLPQEGKFWAMPRFSDHPLTHKTEATGEGLFFRMWPEHVQKILKMKAEGWPHVEIIRVAKELWKRQQDEYAKNEALVQQHKDMDHATEQQDASDIHQGIMSPSMAEPPPEEEAAKGLSMPDGDSYSERLETFRGKFFSKDGSSRYDALVRSGSPKRKRKAPMKYSARSAKMSEGNPFTGGFAVMMKADVPGIRALGGADLKTAKNRVDTQPPAGVTSPSPVTDVIGDDVDLNGR